MSLGHWRVSEFGSWVSFGRDNTLYTFYVIMSLVLDINWKKMFLSSDGVWLNLGIGLILGIGVS